MLDIHISSRHNAGTGGHGALPLPTLRKQTVIEARASGSDVVELVSEVTKVPAAQFFHRSRCKAHIAEARQLAMYLLHVCEGQTMKQVGSFFGRDRTTVSHACAIIEDRRDCMKFDERVAELENRLEEKATSHSGSNAENAGANFAKN